MPEENRPEIERAIASYSNALAQKYLFVGSRAADFVAPWIQILAKAMVKGILGGFDSCGIWRSQISRSLEGLKTHACRLRD